ncbi:MULTISPECIES: 4Fe-4S binding protein [unclassified Fusibacter]|uniref:4Fe-4S binding protein n=1 Tax=unclassified Fusibacter TaxID=2624464 RepID=UPI0010139F05|nr:MULTISPECIES: 4Fe-4S binding protein [unclassified Fusibacter]MCK8061638.1 4Fe-4S binding protein [Fusibacter sp. A2]NPE23822.1 4Fe-4S binding protein [Fusibacter sp. A1]RXV58595.1 4Fe-4S binding protein [Fusibacter sp. A1]
MKKILVIRTITTLVWIYLIYLGLNRNPLITTLILLSTIILGPIFCSWFCPLGFVQNIMGKLGRFIGLPKLEFKPGVHKYLKYSRYLLYFIAFLPFGINGLATFGLEPRRTFTNLLVGEVDTILSLLVFILLVGASLFNERFYCKYLCTKGAEYSLFSSLRIFRIKRTSNCVSCKKCNKECPMQVDLMKSEIVNDITCISCMDCIDVCKVKGSINYTKGLRIPNIIRKKTDESNNDLFKTAK